MFSTRNKPRLSIGPCVCACVRGARDVFLLIIPSNCIDFSLENDRRPTRSIGTPVNNTLRFDIYTVLIDVSVSVLRERLTDPSVCPSSGSQPFRVWSSHMCCRCSAGRCSRLRWTCHTRTEDHVCGRSHCYRGFPHYCLSHAQCIQSTAETIILLQGQTVLESGHEVCTTTGRTVSIFFIIF